MKSIISTHIRMEGLHCLDKSLWTPVASTCATLIILHLCALQTVGTSVTSPALSHHWLASSLPLPGPWHWPHFPSNHWCHPLWPLHLSSRTGQSFCLQLWGNTWEKRRAMKYNGHLCGSSPASVTVLFNCCSNTSLCQRLKLQTLTLIYLSFDFERPALLPT